MNSKNSGKPETAICPSCKSGLTVIYGPNGEALSPCCPQCGPKTFLGRACAYLTRREFLIGAGVAVGYFASNAGPDIYGLAKDSLSNFLKEERLKRQSDEALRLFKKFIGYQTLSKIALPEWILYRTSILLYMIKPLKLPAPMLLASVVWKL